MMLMHFILFIKNMPQVNENEFVTTDIDLLSPILQNSEDSFNHKKSIGITSS